MQLEATHRAHATNKQTLFPRPAGLQEVLKQFFISCMYDLYVVHVYLLYQISLFHTFILLTITAIKYVTQWESWGGSEISLSVTAKLSSSWMESGELYSIYGGSIPQPNCPHGWSRLLSFCTAWWSLFYAAQHKYEGYKCSSAKHSQQYSMQQCLIFQSIETLTSTLTDCPWAPWSTIEHQHPMWQIRPVQCWCLYSSPTGAEKRTGEYTHTCCEL